MEDIKSDFSAIHRIDNIEELSADVFFPRVRRLIAYKGALRFTAEEESEKNNKTSTGRERAVPASEVQHYKSPAHNPEAMALGLFESGTG